MLDLDNRTGWGAEIYPGWSREGRLQMTVVIKAAFTYDNQGKLTPLTPPPPIEEADRYRGEPGKSSLAAACESVPFKAGSEVLLAGTLFPPATDRPVAEATLGILFPDARPWEKTVWAFGARRWERGLLAPCIGRPAALAPVPLLYELAYGGSDPRDADAFHGPNPAGKGFSKRGWGMTGMELPQLEAPPTFITGPTTRVAPAGFGPLSPLWEPRVKAFEHYDKQAAEWGAPFADRALADTYNAAPLDQRFPRPFTGGERLRLKGFHPEPEAREISLLLPRLRPELRLAWEGEDGEQILTPVCDTLTIDTDARTLSLLWRCAVPFSLPEPRGGWVFLRNPAEDAPDTGGDTA